MLDKELTTEKKKLTIGLKTLITIVTVLIVIAGMIGVMRLVGKGKLSKAVAGNDISVGDDTSEDLSDGQIMYDGKIYQLNDDVITVLMMGIDSETVDEVGGQSWSTIEGSAYSGGQADTLFLAVINPHDKKVSFISINRNTMATVDVWDENGDYKGTQILQIALQHGYGYGDEESCEHQVKAVSRLLFDIPINSYAAISMDGIPKLNDAIGGVEVTVLDDIVYPEYNMNLHQGDVVTLKGEKAYWYLRLRNENVFNSNETRLNRQKQYLKAFMSKAISEATSDIKVATNLYNTISDYMVTDIDLTTFTYMATEYLNYDFDLDNIYSLQGETVQGTKYEEFYMDEDAAEKMVVELFYEPVD